MKVEEKTLKLETEDVVWGTVKNQRTRREKWKVESKQGKYDEK